MKPNFKHYNKRKRGGASFWDEEYRTGKHLALSDEPSEDLLKFTRFLERAYNGAYLTKTSQALDLGAGNGRNLIYLARQFGTSGTGFDISGEAVSQAKRKSEAEKLPLVFTVRSIAEPIPLPDESQDLVLDMMTSHFLNESERANLLKEIYRVLKPGGWFFYKTFLLDDDPHAARFLKDYPTGETGTYLHPHIGRPEHVATETEIYDRLAGLFDIQKVSRSHRHRAANPKRRSISVYAQKIY